MKMPSFIPLRVSLVCLAIGLAAACKNENFGKAPNNNNNTNLNPVEKKPAQPATNEPLIPRIESSGDPSELNNFEVGEEASIATDITGTYLSIPKGILEAGKAIAIRATKKVTDATVQSVKMVIPKQTRDSDDNLVVLYRMTSEKGESFYGLIPKKDMDVQENSVSFQPKGLGVYQAAVAPVLITEARQVPVLNATGPRLKALFPAYKTPGTPSDIWVQNASAYVADGAGLEILNWSSSAGFTPNTRVPSPINLTALLGVGTRVYATAGANGISFLDLTKPPVLAPFVDARGQTFSLAVAENLRNLYVTQDRTADGQSRLGISRFDIQQEAPRYETTEQLTEVGTALQIQGVTAFFMSRSNLYSFDITQNDRINLISQLPLSGAGEKLAMATNRAYIADRSAGIAAIDVLNPAAMKTLNTLPLPQALDVAIKGNYLVAVDATKKVSLIDITDPSHLLVLHTLTLTGTPNRVRFFGDLIFITMSDSGLAVLSIETGASP